jgi:hypothetical protein
MNAQQFYDKHGADETQRVCERAETDFAHFLQCMRGKRTFGRVLAARLELASNGEMDQVSLIFGANPPPPADVTLAAVAVRREAAKPRKGRRAA